MALIEWFHCTYVLSYVLWRYRHVLTKFLSLFLYRYTVKELMQHDFFLEESGIRVELVNTDDAKEEQKPNIIVLRVRIVDPKKRKTQHKENEAIQFFYNLEKDVPETVAQEMVRKLGWAVLTVK